MGFRKTTPKQAKNKQDAGGTNRKQDAGGNPGGIPPKNHNRREPKPLDSEGKDAPDNTAPPSNHIKNRAGEMVYQAASTIKMWGIDLPDWIASHCADRFMEHPKGLRYLEAADAQWGAMTWDDDGEVKNAELFKRVKMGCDTALKTAKWLMTVSENDDGTPKWEDLIERMSLPEAAAKRMHDACAHRLSCGYRVDNTQDVD